MKADGSAGRSRQGMIFCGICLLCALMIKPVQDGFEARIGEPEPELDLLYFSSPSAVKRIALGYDSLLADFYWMRAIQYYGRREEADKRPVRFKNLFTLFDITTTLDPNMMDAYRTGSMFLGEPEPVGAGQPQQSLKLLDKGIAAHPQNWELRYDKGFVYYLYLKDYQKAGEVWMGASKLPTAPYWMSGLAAMSLSKGGAIEVAIALWQRQYQETHRADVRENARNHLLSFQVARDLATLESLIARYKTKTGAFPPNLPEVNRGRTHRFATVDPLGTPYGYDPDNGNVWLSLDTKIKYLPVSKDDKEQLRITNDE
jgi:tetratricopeptide (TPR) repeat protein